MEISAKFKDIIEKIEAMSVLELSDLVKVLEEKFGVSAQAVRRLRSEFRQRVAQRLKKKALSTLSSKKREPRKSKSSKF